MYDINKFELHTSAIHQQLRVPDGVPEQTNEGPPRGRHDSSHSNMNVK
jgi:hypothetical protein